MLPLLRPVTVGRCSGVVGAVQDNVKVCHERPEELNDARYVIELPYVCLQRFAQTFC